MSELNKTFMQDLFSLNINDDILNGVGDVFDVMWVYSGHWDSSVLYQMDVVLFDKAFYLWLVETGVWEHPDLLSNVVPRTCLLKIKIPGVFSS